MNNMVEINRRSMYFTDEGIACGPVSTTAIDAEITVEDNGRRVYLHAQWVDAAPDDFCFEANTESMYDAYERLNELHDDDEEFDKALEERDRIAKESSIPDDACYETFYDELKQMIRDEMEAHGISEYFDEDEE